MTIVLARHVPLLSAKRCVTPQITATKKALKYLKSYKTFISLKYHPSSLPYSPEEGRGREGPSRLAPLLWGVRKRGRMTFQTKPLLPFITISCSSRYCCCHVLYLTNYFFLVESVDICLLCFLLFEDILIYLFVFAGFGKVHSTQVSK